MTIQPTIVLLAVELRRPTTTGRIMIARRGHPNLDFVQEVGTRSTASLIRPTERWWLLPKTDAAVTNLLSAYVVSQIRTEATFISFLPQTLNRFSFRFFHTVRISPIRWPYERTNMLPDRRSHHQFIERLCSADESWLFIFSDFHFFHARTNVWFLAAYRSVVLLPLLFVHYLYLELMFLVMAFRVWFLNFSNFWVCHRVVEYDVEHDNGCSAVKSAPHIQKDSPEC